jgi:hypothetical protein
MLIIIEQYLDGIPFGWRSGDGVICVNYLVYQTGA